MLHNSKTEVQNNQVTNAKYLKNKIFKLKEEKKTKHRNQYSPMSKCNIILLIHTVHMYIYMYLCHKVEIFNLSVKYKRN